MGYPGTRLLFGVPLYIFAQTLRAIGKTLLGYLTLPEDKAFRQEIIVWHFLGVIAGLAKK